MDRRQRWALTVPVLVVSGYALFADTTWIGGWAATVDRVTGSTVLTGPVLASVAAGLQLSLVRLRPISDTTARGWRVPHRCALHAWTSGMVAYLATLAVAIGCTASVPHGGPAQWWTSAAGVLVLALAALFGTLVAHLLPSPVAVLAAGPALFLIGAFGPAPLPALLRFGPTGSMTGSQIVPSVYLTRFAALAAICLALAVAAAWRERPRRPGVVAAGGVAGVAVLLGAGGVFSTTTGIGDSRLEASGERPTACAGEDPTVCVMPSHRRYLDAVRRSVDEAAPVLSEAGVALPERYEERFGTLDLSEGSGSFSIDPHQTDERTFRDSVRLLVRPADCPQWSSEQGPPFAAWDAEQLVAEWAVARHGDRPEAFNQEMDAWLPHIDDPATTRWVVQTFELLKSCRFGQIAMPWEGR